MGHNICCIVNCKNNGRNSLVKFYTFPNAWYKEEQKRRWIATIRKINNDLTWNPKRSTTICSFHFIGDKKSNEIEHPSYEPTIFSNNKKSKLNHTAVLERFNRLKRRNNRKKFSIKKVPVPVIEKPMQLDERIIDTVHEENSIELFAEKRCQANIFIGNCESAKSFTCNRYIYTDSICSDAQTQTEIPENDGVRKIPDKRKFKKVGCNTDSKNEFAIKCIGLDFITKDDKKLLDYTIIRIEHIKNDEALLELCGVT